MDDATEQFDLSIKFICEKWNKRINKAREAKSGFQTVADMCDKFYSAQTSFMWKEGFAQKYLGGDLDVKIQMTVAKAFEFVAIYLPFLYWQYPNREVKSYKKLELTPEAFGDPEDQYTIELFNEVSRLQNIEEARNDSRNQVMERYLNYTQREQPGGGLSVASQDAITEALVKGRGCIWIEQYSPPGSDRTLTQGVYSSVDNLFIDPDAESPRLTDARWIARRHYQSVEEVERRFKLKPGSLRDKASHESAESQSSKDSPSDKHYRRIGRSSDMIEWYEIFSKCGVGTKATGVTQGVSNAFDDWVGDYAYICVAPGVDFPLNAPSRVIQDATKDEIRSLFQWPVPYWADNRFPVALLDFYSNPRSVWPVAPLAMGLGELIFLNIMMSVIATRAYYSSQEIIAMLKSASSDIEKKLKSSDSRIYLEINDLTQDSISKVVQFLQRPEMSSDVYNVIRIISDMFDRRVGLTELLYGMSTKVSRTAEDSKNKHEMVSIRPDYMSNKVEDWQSEIANIERICAIWNVEGKDVEPLLGIGGAYVWDNLIANEDPEVVLREMKATVEAGSARKPNKERDNANIQDIAQYLLTILDSHANATGDTGPINGFLRMWGDARDSDVSELMMGERKPSPPSEEEIAAQQQMQQMQMAKLQAEVEGKQMDAQLKQLDAESKLFENQQSQMESERMVSEADAEMIRRMDELEFDRAKNESELEAQQRKAELDLLAQEDASQMNLMAFLMKADAELRAKQQQEELKLRTMSEEARIRLRVSELMAAQKQRMTA